MKRQRRNKGEGSITKLPSGKYKLTITIGRDITGKQRRKSVTANTRKELLDKGVDVKTVSRRLGHKSVTTTLDVYYNYLPALDDKASTLLDTLVD